MTPALLFALEQQRLDDLHLESFPIDKLAWMYASANRDLGEKDADGRVVRPPTPALKLEMFRSFARAKGKSLAAKDSGTGNWDYSLLGARADKAAFEAWAGSKPTVTIKAIKEH